MLRMEATVGGCCWSFEPPWARRVGAAASAPSRTMDTAEFFIGFSLSCGAGAQDLTLSRPEKSSSSFTDRKSTRLNSSHVSISYAVFCLKKKNNHQII